MTIQRVRRILFPCLWAAVLFLAPGLATTPGEPTNGNVFSLQAPPFVSVARAETGSIASVIEDEAGLSAYWQAPASIDLNDVRGAFRTIEVETADYIIGSVPVMNYPESEDVHVYVHRDGWILAYYLAGDPVGKIFDWRMYHDTGRTAIHTKLENTLTVVADAAGIPFSSASYYDFRYPNATHLMLIVEWVYSAVGQYASDSFQIKLPGSFGYYERSWSLGTSGVGWYKLNGIEICRHGGEWWSSSGTSTTSQLLPDQFHWVEVGTGYGVGYVYGGLALVYRVP